MGQATDGETIAAAKAAMQRGDLLRAFEIADAGHAITGTSRLNYFRALALARMGDAEGALAALDGREGMDVGDEDLWSLRGRVWKDVASAASGAERQALFAKASRAYREAHDRSGGYFSLINAATLARLAGARDEAASLAAAVLRDPAVVAADSFYAAATHAEALVVLDRFEEAVAVFSAAIALPDADHGSRAAAARQLRLISRQDPAVAALVGMVRPPAILFYAGHMFRADERTETVLAARIDDALDALDIQIAYGGAAAGADILVAEAVLRRGGHLNIVLPFPEDDYRRQSVLPSGAAWLDRFDGVIEAADSVEFASTTPFVGDPHQFDHGNRYAMGAACLRAQHLETEAVQLAIWDGGNDREKAGTGAGLDAWNATGRRTVIVPSGPIDRLRDPVPDAPVVAMERQSRAIIFTDYAGFSALSEAALPLFLDGVMAQIAAVLDTRPDDVLTRNSWGDALFAVVSGPAAAAELALAIQERLATLDPTTLGMPPTAGTRLALHHGPVYAAIDPITRQLGYFGTEVTRTARIEPVTPVGQVYVTQAFAVELALLGDTGFQTRYVGQTRLAKNFGTVAMHRLVRA